MKSLKRAQTREVNEDIVAKPNVSAIPKTVQRIEDYFLGGIV